MFEKYYEPFTADFSHGIYSETKSLVALAVGFAEQEGLLSLDDSVDEGKYGIFGYGYLIWRTCEDTFSLTVWVAG